MTRNPHSEFLRYHYGDEISDATIQDNDVEKLKLMIEDLNGKVDNLTNLTLALLQEIRRLNTL
jgi:hypothetical protein